MRSRRAAENFGGERRCFGDRVVVRLTENCDPCTHLDRDKRSDSCSLSWEQSEVTERGQLSG